MKKHTHINRSIKALVVLLYITCLPALFGLESMVTPTQVPENEKPVFLTGTFFIVWGDPGSGTSSSHQMRYFLATEKGETVILDLDAALVEPLGGVLALKNRKIVVAGQWVKPTLSGGRYTIRAQAIQLALEEENKSPALAGSQPWVSILCKFADVADEPRNLAYFQGMYANTFPGEDHYWREISYNAINLVGSTAVAWHTLPQPRSYYVYDSNGDGFEDLDFARAANDCTAVADPYVYYPNYVGINLMFNANLDCCAWGGGNYLSLDGVTRLWYMTWEPPWGYENISIISHEMGHGFGMPHSSGDYGQVYDNAWDVMSGAWAFCENLTDPLYGCVGQDTITYHLNLESWISPGRKIAVLAGNQVSIQLEQIDRPQTSNYLMAQIPVGNSSTHFFTVEARRKIGYDSKLPGQGVIIHEVITNRPEPAHVVDIDGNGNTGDAGAIWTVGETFTAPGSGIWVRVDSAAATGWIVTLYNPPLNVIQVNSMSQSPGGSGDCTLGEAIQAANTDAAVDGCIAGSGADRIILPAGVYNLGLVDNSVDGSNGLPDITSAIILQGAGSASTFVQRQSAAPAFRIFHISSAGSLDISGVRVSNGNAGSANGGAFHAGGNLILNNCIVDTSVANRGGGVYVALGMTAAISTTTISDNTSNTEGGGVFNEGMASITSSTISGNTSAANAAGIENWFGLLTLSSSTVTGNIAEADGGGLLDLAGLTTVNDCAFSGNSGSAIYSNSGTLDIIETQVLNDAETATRGIDCWYCKLTVGDSVLYQNDSGAIYAYSSQPLEVNNTCIAGNGDTSVYSEFSSALMDAANNWWGAADGPSGAGNGHGDLVSPNVTFFPYLQQRPLACPALAPVAGLYGTPIIGYSPLQVLFTNASRGEFQTCAWTFGDGGTSTSCSNPSHIYQLPGVYTVTLTVSGPGGSDMLARSGYIQVMEGTHTFMPVIVK